MRHYFQLWRWQTWDNRVEMTRADYQASIDADGVGSRRLEARLTRAMVKRAKWRKRFRG